MRETGNAYRLSEGKKPPGRVRRRWADNIKLDLGEMGWGWCGMNWEKGQVESSCESGNEHSGCTKCCEGIKWLQN
jgi:hypothetical protein